MTCFSWQLYLKDSLLAGKFISRFILIAAVLSLACLVISLGAAAKHSQFEQHAHHSFYLGKAVKMVSDHSGGHADLACLPETVNLIVPAIVAVSPCIDVSRDLPAVPLRTIPLLI